MDEHVEAALVAQAQRGDVAAFTRLVERYQQPIGGYLWRLVGREDLARDLTQDTFLRAYRALPQTTPGLHLRGWLYRIATNLACDVLRRERRLRWLPLETVEDASGGDATSAVPERVLVQAVLRRLRPSERTILLLCGVEGLMYAEAAEVLGTTPEAARKQFTRAKARFRTAYEAERGTAD